MVEPSAHNRIIPVQFRASLPFLLLSLVSCSPAMDEDKWVEQQTSKCWAMYGKATYSKNTKVFECYNKPFMRYPKLMFEAKYGNR